METAIQPILEQSKYTNEQVFVFRFPNGKYVEYHNCIDGVYSAINIIAHEEGGVPHGEVIEYCGGQYVCGKYYYDRGVKIGRWVYFYEDGNVCETVDYVGGERVEIKKYAVTGILSESTKYSDEKEKSILYDTNGRVNNKKTIKNGIIKIK